MKILITGGAGMVGSHCAEYFVKQGHKVVVYDNLMRSQIFGSHQQSVEYNWRYLHRYSGITFYKKDIRDAATLTRCFQKHEPDVVIHTAGQPGVRFSLDNAYEDFTINAQGTVQVLEAFRKINPKGAFVYCSTNKVYGEHVNDIPLKELQKRYAFKGKSGLPESQTVDHTGHTPYGVSKLAGDLYVQDYAHTYGLKTGVFRMSCIYGTRQFGFEDQGWIAWFTICFLLGKPIVIYGDGKQVRDVLWVEDLIQAFAKFIKSPLRHGVFNMGGGPKNTLSLLELVGHLQEITGRKVPIRFEDWRKFDQKVYVSSIEKAKKVLRWQATIAPKEGIARLVRWVEDNRGIFG